MTDHIVNKYFKSSSYWLVDGCPYFSIYELFNFVASMGGVRGTAKALAEFREKVRAAGFRDLHLNAVTWGVKLLPGQTEVSDLKGLLEQLEVDSTTSYVWLHHAELSTFPVTQYDEMGRPTKTIALQRRISWANRISQMFPWAGIHRLELVSPTSIFQRVIPFYLLCREIHRRSLVRRSVPRNYFWITRLS